MALTKITGEGVGAVDSLTVDTNTLLVDAANNRVGIGKTPAYTLDIHGVTAIKDSESLTWQGNAQLSSAIVGSGSGATLHFWTSANERMRIQSGGVVSFSTGIELGSALDGTAANTLSDYEEGDWEPTLLGASSNPTVSYSGDNGGHYIKIGTLLYLTGCLRYNSRSGGSGAARLGGLPFTIDARSNGDNSDGCGPMRVNVWNGTDPKPTLFGARQNDDKLNIYSTDEDHTSTTLDVGDMGTACMMQFTIVVHTAS